MTTTYDIYHKNQKTYIDTVEFDKVDNTILENASGYYYSEDQRCPSDYIVVDEQKEEDVENELEMKDLEDYMNNNEPPMTDGEFHRWANPSL